MWSLKNLDALKCGGWGVFIALTTKVAVGEAVCRWVHRTVRCASHVTQPLGFDRWSSDRWGHRTVRWCTGQSLFTVRCAFWRLLWLYAHCSRIVALLQVSVGVDRCAVVVAPLAHRTVRWNIAEWHFQKPEGSELELIHPGAPDSPVRQTRAAFGFILLLSFEPNLGLLIGLCWTFGTCRTYNLEQTS
jgi:hypothetical protein